MMHFVRWSPRERLAFIADGRRGMAYEVELVAEAGAHKWCPLCRAPVVRPTGRVQDDPGRRYLSVNTPVWCCVRDPSAEPVE